MAFWLARIRAQTLTLSGRFSRSVSSRVACADPIEKTDDDDVESLASYVTARVDEFIKHGSRPLPLVLGSEVYVNDIEFSSYEEDIRLEIMNLMASVLKRYPEADPIQVRSITPHTCNKIGRTLITRLKIIILESKYKIYQIPQILLGSISLLRSIGIHMLQLCKLTKLNVRILDIKILQVT